MAQTPQHPKTPLKRLIEAAGLTEVELASRTGLGQPLVHRLCSDKNQNPKINTLKPLARYFGVSIDTLIGEAPLALTKTVQSRALLHKLLTELQAITEAVDNAMQRVTAFLAEDGSE